MYVAKLVERRPRHQGQPAPPGVLQSGAHAGGDREELRRRRRPEELSDLCRTEVLEMRFEGQGVHCFDAEGSRRFCRSAEHEARAQPGRAAPRPERGLAFGSRTGESNVGRSHHHAEGLRGLRADDHALGDRPGRIGKARAVPGTANARRAGRRQGHRSRSGRAAALDGGRHRAADLDSLGAGGALAHGRGA